MVKYPRVIFEIFLVSMSVFMGGIFKTFPYFVDLDRQSPGTYTFIVVA